MNISLFFCNFVPEKLNKNKSLMKTKKILYVTSEVIPYHQPETEHSKLSFDLAKALNTTGGQVRIFTPRYGNINERRHQLHEVIRLSGMNLVINDIDMPLIIKVASVAKERIQVYFIDNDEYFKKKYVFSDEKGVLFPDNDERCIFFAKGVVETVRKLNWTPDIIHIKGWLGALLPVYLRTIYKDDPIFSQAKIVISFTEDMFEGTLNKTLANKLAFDEIPKEFLKEISEPSCVNLMKIAVKNCDIVTGVKSKLPENFEAFLKKIKKTAFLTENSTELIKNYPKYFEQILEM